MRLAWRLFPLALLSLLLFACGSAGGEEDVTSTTERLVIRRTDGDLVRLAIELADTPAELTAGLSKRESLAADAGMLFDFGDRGRGFWMKDTLIPLTAAFISACGEIVATADMAPNTLQIHNTDRPYRFGLEVNQGWFASKGVKVGDSVILPPELQPEGCSA